jgi:MFS transporter, PAT family, beta-lactamase induction signal transducer AmpG
VSVSLRAVVLNPRVAAALVFGFVSGLPYALSQGTLQAWLAQAGVDLKTIGWLTLVSLPYTLKFVWAPLMDRYVPPFWGRRRGWMACLQLSLALMIFLLGQSDPTGALTPVAVLAVAVAFLSASNDIVIDAYRTDLLQPQERGLGSTVTQLGYRVAMLLSGALALILATPLGWSGTYALMAAIMLLTVLLSWAAPEPPAEISRSPSLRAALIEPFVQYLSQPAAVGLLVLVLLYKVGDATALSLSTAFLIKGVGFTVTEVGVVAKTTTTTALLLGTLIGGLLYVRLGLFYSLWCFGLLQAVTNLLYSWLAFAGHDILVMMTAVGFDNLAGAMGSTAFGAFLMALCDRRFSATQFALLTAIAALPRSLVGPLAAAVVAAIGWVKFYMFTFILGLVPLLLLWLLRAKIERLDEPR